MCRCRKNPPKCAWAQARAHRNSGSPRSSPAASCSRLTAWIWKPPRKQCAWARPNCPFTPNSSSAARKRKTMAKKAAKTSKLGKTDKAKKVASARTSSKADDFRAKSVDELNTELTGMKKEQFNLRFQRANGQAENTGRIRIIRRNIARIETVLNEQRRAPAQKPAKA